MITITPSDELGISKNELIDEAIQRQMWRIETAVKHNTRYAYCEIFNNKKYTAIKYQLKSMFEEKGYVIELAGYIDNKSNYSYIICL